jgi:hypothetical protein
VPRRSWTVCPCRVRYWPGLLRDSRVSRLVWLVDAVAPRPAVIIRNPQLAVRTNSSGTSMFMAALKDSRYATVLSVLRSAMVCLRNVFCLYKCCLVLLTRYVCLGPRIVAGGAPSAFCCCRFRVHLVYGGV